jgi:hypothetical protein
LKCVVKYKPLLLRQWFFAKVFEHQLKTEAAAASALAVKSMTSARRGAQANSAAPHPRGRKKRLVAKWSFSRRARLARAA